MTRGERLSWGLTASGFALMLACLAMLTALFAVSIYRSEQRAGGLDCPPGYRMLARACVEVPPGR